MALSKLKYRQLIKLHCFPAWQFRIGDLLPCSTFILSAFSVTTFTGYCSLDSDGVGIIPKGTDIRIVTAPSQLALVPKVFLHWVLAKALCQYKLCSFLKEELCGFNDRMNCHPYALMCLPGQEHSTPSILAEVSWPVLCTLLPKSQVLQELHQELESVIKQEQ